MGQGFNICRIITSEISFSLGALIDFQHQDTTFLFRFLDRKFKAIFMAARMPEDS